VRETGWSLLLAALARLPQRALSGAAGHLADIRIPRGARAQLLGGFARIAGIDVGEAERSLEEYATLNEFFVRRLRPGIRSWPAEPDAVGSPVDGVLGQFGRIERGELVQAKGMRYTAAGLLADPAAAERFHDGLFLTLYLSPRHYHRVHAPVSGTIAQARRIPGTLLPVNRPALTRIPSLFARNTRVVCYMDGAVGRSAIVAIGAYNVGRISVAVDPPHAVARGDELMAFHLGSTVVLLFESGAVILRDDLATNREVRLGQTLATHA
jgi:phosphatidylserine decarboxylase